MATSTTTSLPNYHRNKHGNFGKGSAKYKVKTIYAGEFGYVSATIAVNGVTNVWQGIQTLPLADSDEMHHSFSTPDDMNCLAPVYVRFLIISANADDTITLTCSADQVSAGDTAADGATVFTDTIPAVASAANKVAQSKWGKISGGTSDYDYLFIKAIASAAGNADGSKLWAMQIAYTPLTKS